MAGVANSSPMIRSSIPSTRATYPAYALSSFESKLFGIHLRYRTVSFVSISTSVRGFTVTGRFGGPRFDSRRKRKEEPDDDQALDLSTVRSDTVRLIDQKQNMLGIFLIDEAIQIAEDAGLDLVILSPEADPPVLKIMDYSQSRGFKGAQNGVIVNMKGRENQFRNNAIELLRRFQDDVGEMAIEETKNLRERNMFIILIPNKAVQPKPQEPPKKKKEPTVNEVSAGVEF